MIECPICGKEFTNKGNEHKNLRSHVRFKHDIEIPESLEKDKHKSYIKDKFKSKEGESPEQKDVENGGGDKVSDSEENSSSTEDKFSDGLAIARKLVDEADDSHGINEKRSKDSNSTADSESKDDGDSTDSGGNFFPISPTAKKWLGITLAAGAAIAVGAVTLQNHSNNVDDVRETGENDQQSKTSGSGVDDVGEHKDNGKGDSSNIVRAAEVKRR